MDLIDDLAPCDLLKRYDSGVRTTRRVSRDDPRFHRCPGDPGGRPEPRGRCHAAAQGRTSNAADDGVGVAA